MEFQFQSGNKARQSFRPVSINKPINQSIKQASKQARKQDRVNSNWTKGYD